MIHRCRAFPATRYTFPSIATSKTRGERGRRQSPFRVLLYVADINVRGIEAALDTGRGGLKGGHMKRSAKTMSFVIALGVTTSMVPQTSAQTPPPSAPQQAPDPQPTQPQPQKSTQEKAKEKARGAAGGALIGGAMGGHAAAGAVIGAGHSLRQERRGNR